MEIEPLVFGFCSGFESQAGSGERLRLLEKVRGQFLTSLICRVSVVIGVEPQIAQKKHEAALWQDESGVAEDWNGNGVKLPVAAANNDLRPASKCFSSKRCRICFAVDSCDKALEQHLKKPGLHDGRPMKARRRGRTRNALGFDLRTHLFRMCARMDKPKPSQAAGGRKKQTVEVLLMRPGELSECFRKREGDPEIFYRKQQGLLF